MKMGFEKKFHYVRFFLIAFLFSGVFGVFKVSAGETVGEAVSFRVPGLVSR